MSTACRLASFLVLALACSACLGNGNSINAYGGKRSMESSDWDEVDNPTVYGADAVLKLDLPLLAVEGGWFHGEDDSSAFPEELSMDDYFIGLRIVPWPILIEPYGSIGITYLDSQIDGGVSDDEDEVFAYYLRLGAAFTLGIVRFGLDGRGLFNSDVDFAGLDTDVDNYQLTAFIGLGF